MSKTNRQTVIITGASSGLGLGIAQAYANRGANLVLNGRNEGKLRAAAKELGDRDRLATPIGDVASRETRDKLIEVAVERFGRVDVIVNNGGHFFPKPFAEYSEEDLDRFLAVHLKGTYFTSQAAVKQMRPRELI